jgi:hypothetical protein
MKLLLITFTLILPTALWSDANLQQKFTISCASDQYLIVIDPTEQTWEAKKPILTNKFLCQNEDAFWGARITASFAQTKTCALTFNHVIRFNLWTKRLESNLGSAECTITN